MAQYTLCSKKRNALVVMVISLTLNQTVQPHDRYFVVISIHCYKTTGNITQLKLN